MVDWLSSMVQTFEYYVVEPTAWKDVKLLNNVKSCTINRDLDTETLGSATIDITESVGECYVRVYLVTIQNGIREKHPLGTFLVQTPSSNFDGKTRNVSMDAYTPLLEIKENQPPLGYFVPKETNVMEMAYLIAREHTRAPVVKPSWTSNHTTDSEGKPLWPTKLSNDFVADTNDTWLSFLRDLISNCKYNFSLDELGRIMFSPKQETASLQPVWTYNDDNSSILYPEMSMNHDLYGIPNVVEVIYTEPNLKDYYYCKVVNDDINSPTSTVNRGREIIYRVTDPDFVGIPANKNQVQEYTERLLKELSTIEYTITYKHGYCPVKLGDCVRLNYSRAGLKNIKAKVISQSIRCRSGCEVTEKAVFTTKLWR